MKRRMEAYGSHALPMICLHLVFAPPGYKHCMCLEAAAQPAAFTPAPGMATLEQVQPTELPQVECFCCLTPDL